MSMARTHEQVLLADGAAQLLAQHWRFEQRRAAPAQRSAALRTLWRHAAQLGWAGIGLPEQFGGAGGLAESIIVLEALGRALVPLPFCASVVLGGHAVATLGTARQQQAILPDLAQGRMTLAVALHEPGAGPDPADVATSARRADGHWVLSGRKLVLLDGAEADQVLVVARMSGERRDRFGLGLFLLPAGTDGLAIHRYRTFDGGDAADLALDRARLSDDALLGASDEAWPHVALLADRAIVALCGEAVGVMGAALEITLDYVRTRQQFGRAIGGFQVVQHRLADAYVAVEEARSLLAAAVEAFDAGDAARRRLVSAAKVQIGRSGRLVGEEAIQLHGGIGMTEDYRIGHHYKRLVAIDSLFGDADHHLGLLADGLVARPGSQ